MRRAPSRLPQAAADRTAPTYPIRTVARMTELSPQRIGSWEREYGLLRPHRTDGGHRLYSRADVERLLWIKRMVQERGLSLQGVKRLLEENTQERRP